MKLLLLKLLVIFTLVLTQNSTYSRPIVLFGVAPDSYMTEILKLALAHLPDKNYRVETYHGGLPKFRAFEQMNNGQGIDVVFGGATDDREQQYLPIRFPLLRGLNGWRAPLVHKDNQSLLADVANLGQLQQYKAGSFHTWSDTRVLESNELPVIKATDYPALYNMLDKKRFDYFPRSVLEIENDLATFKHFDIAIDSNILIYYPTAYYFFVSQDNHALALDILIGLNKAIQDGSFDALYMRYFGKAIKTFRSDNRKVIRLTNPFLPPETPLADESLWIDLEQPVQ